MGGNCEIVEEKDEPSTTQLTLRQSRSKERDKKHPTLQKGPNKFLEDDINKLFESVNLRASKSLDLTDSYRNASKKPMRVSYGFNSPIGFSEPVSLKQALRGLCISQAAEMAAAKRLASPRISNLMKSATQSSCSSPVSSVHPILKNIECISSEISPSKPPVNLKEPKTIPVCEEDNQLVVNVWSQEEKLDMVSVPPHQNIPKPERKVSGSKKVASVASEISTTSSKVRRKSRLQTVTSFRETKSNKETKPMRSNSRAIKPVVIKRPIKLAVTNGGNSKSLNGVNNGSENSSGKLVCQMCQCSMKEPVSFPTANENRDISEVKNNILSDKGFFPQSSKSSVSDFSSSTTSLSEESSLSGSSSGTRPHMSKDMRWGAIKGHFGFVGLSQFKLLKKLGAGDIGTVYLAELIGTNCPFAIKVMDTEFLGKRKKMARAQTEREILRMLDHPFLPTLYAQFTSDNLSCLVMEFCPGGDLHVLRQKQPGGYFPEQAARFYAAEVLLALEYLHMLGIIYRDLKPENILVREDGHIMLTDFDLSLRCSVNPTLIKSSAPGIEPPRVSGPCAGSSCIDPFCSGTSCKMSCFSPRIPPTSARARKLKAEVVAQARSLPQLVAEPTGARSNSFVGTHEYLAPEIIKGEGHGSAVDWWTFGVLLYELLYGKTPFRGAGNDETLSNLALQGLKFPDTPIVSSQAMDLIRGLLVKDPDNRFGTETGAAEIKRHPFFEGLNWALIRCTVPPQIPEFYEVGNLNVECEGKGGHLEFELF